MKLSLRDHVKPALKQLHWLPVQQRITYKLCMFMHQIHNGQAPQYLSDCVSTVSAASHRYRQRSSGSAVYVLPRTRTRFAERGFFYSGPATWNTLPTFTTLLIPVLSENDSRVYFWIMLTTDYCWRSLTCRIAAPYKYRVDWLIDWLIASQLSFTAHGLLVYDSYPSKMTAVLLLCMADG